MCPALAQQGQSAARFTADSDITQEVLSPLDVLAVAALGPPPHSTQLAADYNGYQGNAKSAYLFVPQHTLISRPLHLLGR